MWRWQPYSSQICFVDLDQMFAQLRGAMGTGFEFWTVAESNEQEITDFADVVMVEESLQVLKINESLCTPARGLKA